jgi:hypothetical protein
MKVQFDEEEDIINYEGTIFREVKSAREAGSGIATGRRSTKTSFGILLGSANTNKAMPVRVIAGDDETVKAINARQTQGTSFGEKVQIGVNAATGEPGNGGSLMAGDPIPGLDVKLKRLSDGVIINTVTDENGFINGDLFVEGEYELQTIFNGKWKDAPVAIKVNNSYDVLLKSDTDADGKTESLPSKIVTHVSGDPHVDQKDGYKTPADEGIPEYAINTIQSAKCANGVCAMMCLIFINGKEYQATVTSVLKTKHDTVKNSINNIR